MYKKDSDTYLQNVAMVLEYIYRNPKTSRIEISHATGLTPAAITHIVNELIKKQWVLETGDEFKETAGSGRRRKVLVLNHQIGYLIGIEFNMKGIFLAVTDMLGNTLVTTSKLSDDYDVNDINHVITSLISDSIQGLEVDKIFGVGIAIPGHFDATQQSIITNNPMWEHFNLNEIKKSFPFPFAVENNIECMALGQYLFHPLHTPDKFLFFHIGYGLFCSFFNAEHLGPKENYYIGEIGHTVVDLNGPSCECGKNGCLQTYISNSWLLKKAQFLFDHSNNTALKGLVESPDDITIETIINAYELGDIYLNQQIDLGITLLGISVANTLIMHDGDKIYLNSELLSKHKFHNQLLALVKEQLSFIPTKRDIQIEITEINDHRGACGACALVAFSFFIKNKNFSQ